MNNAANMELADRILPTEARMTSVTVVKVERVQRGVDQHHRTIAERVIDTEYHVVRIENSDKMTIKVNTPSQAFTLARQLSSARVEFVNLGDDEDDGDPLADMSAEEISAL